MKKIILSFILILTVLLTGCDNNEGPYEIKKENGVLIMYSDSKPAKGIITNTVQDRSGNSVVVSEIYYDKGLPAGDFILRNLNGYTVAEAKGEWTGPGSFKGTINSHDSKSKGVYTINTNYLINFDQYLKFPIKDCLNDGKYSGSVGETYPNTGVKSENIVKKNSKLREHTTFYSDKQIREKIIYNENGYEIERVLFYENGQMYQHSQRTDTSNFVKRWTEDGELYEINERDKNYKTLESYNVFKKGDELIPNYYYYNKNGKEMEINIDPHAEIGRGFRVFKMKGFESESESEAEKILPKRLMDYIKKAIEISEKDKEGVK